MSDDTQQPWGSESPTLGTMDVQEPARERQTSDTELFARAIRETLVEDTPTLDLKSDAGAGPAPHQKIYESDPFVPSETHTLDCRPSRRPSKPPHSKVKPKGHTNTLTRKERVEKGTGLYGLKAKNRHRDQKIQDKLSEQADKLLSTENSSPDEASLPPTSANRSGMAK